MLPSLFILYLYYDYCNYWGGGSLGLFENHECVHVGLPVVPLRVQARHPLTAQMVVVSGAVRRVQFSRPTTRPRRLTSTAAPYLAWVSPSELAIACFGANVAIAIEIKHISALDTVGRHILRHTHHGVACEVLLLLLREVDARIPGAGH
jgi:hypothetical protein